VSGGDAAAPERVNCTLPSHPRYLPLIRALVAETASLVGFDTDITHRVVLAVTEAFTNVIRHAYGQATVKPIDLEIWIEDDTLRLDLIDYGRFIDPKHIASRPLDEIRPGGLGVHLIKTTMDRVEYRENDHGGTTLTMVKRLPSEKESS
jgi:sigma-B regulation protein RsbU (phosphoserine phosphatase)